MNFVISSPRPSRHRPNSRKLPYLSFLPLSIRFERMERGLGGEDECRKLSYNISMAAQKDFARHLSDFLSYLEITKNRSKNTVKNYHFYLRRFAALMNVRAIRAITPEAVKRYRLLLNRTSDRFGRPLSRVTQNYHLIALRSFLKFLAKEDLAPIAPEKIELAKLPERQVAFLDAEELDRLFTAPESIDQAPMLKRRDRAILETLFSTGLRVSELATLQRDALRSKKGELSIRGKGGRVRVVFLSQKAHACIGAYIESRSDHSPFLFIRHDRAAKSDIAEQTEPLTARSIERMIKRYGSIAGIAKRTTPHTLRHSFATDLLLNGADLRAVQALLGHASITTTQVYTHVTDKHLREVHSAFHGKQRR